MATTETQKLVQEALTKGWAIYTELKTAQDTAQDARNAYNELKGKQNSKEQQEAGDRAVAQKVLHHTGIYDAAVAEAQKKLDIATEIFTRAEAAAAEARRQADGKASEEWVKELAETNRKLNLLAAEAQAQAHIEEQKAGALQASLDRHRQQTRDQLGVDLGSVLETP